MSLRYCLHIGLFLFLLSGFSKAFAQPANNLCEDAIDISSSIGGNVCGDDGGGTNDPDDGDVTTCWDEDGEVWYSFSGVNSVDVAVTSFCGGTTGFEPNFSIYEGSCGGGLTQLGCGDYGDDGQVTVGGLDPAQTYYMSVENDECDGSFCFDISEVTLPPNDTCEGAIDISSSFGGTFCGEDTSATNDPDDGDVTSCDDEDSEVWYSFTGQETAKIQIQNWCDSTGDYSEPNISLYEGSCGGGLSEIACDDLGDPLIASGLDPAQIYYLSVDNDATDCNEGDFCFDIGEFVPPPNDTCEGAIDISSSFGGTFCGEDTSATNDPNDGDVTSCDDEDSEVWYSFTGQETVEIQIQNWCDSTGDYSEPNISLYEGSCGGGLSELACDDLGDPLMVSSLDPAQTYYLSVDNDATDCNEGDFCFDIGEIDSTGECLSNPEGIDGCGTSFTLNNSGMQACGYECCGSTRNSNYDDACGASTCGSCSDGCDMDGSTENNAFWSFTPGETCDYEVTLNVDNCSSGSGIQYGIYEYVGGTFTDIYAHDGTQSGAPATITESFTAYNGDPVVIMVDGYAGDECDVGVSVDPVDCAGCTVLPVELLSFEGEAEEEGNLLRWRTASEEGAERFVLERSPDGREFEALMEKEAKGSGSGMNAYRALDKAASAGTNYYRLEQFDEDGSSERSDVVAIERNASAAEGLRIEKIHPNPSGSERIHLQIQASRSSEVELRVFDGMGKEVRRTDERVTKGRNRLRMELEGLSTGFYTLRVQRKQDPSQGSNEHFVVE